MKGLKVNKLLCILPILVILFSNRAMAVNKDGIKGSTSSRLNGYRRIVSRSGKDFIYKDMRGLLKEGTKGWIVKDFSFENGTKGELLETNGYDISAIRIPIKLKGYFKVHIGYVSGTGSIQIKKSTDKECTTVTNDSTYIPKDNYGEQYLYEKFAFVSNFKDEELVLNAKYYDTPRIVYIKVTGMKGKEIKLYNTVNEGNQKKRVMYDNDGYSSFCDGIFPNSSSLDNMLVKPLSEKNVGILNWCLGTTGLLNYNSKYAGRVFESFDKYPNQLRDIDKKAQEQVLSIAKEGKSPLEFLATFGEDKNLEVFASLRMNTFYEEEQYGFLNGNMYSSYKDVKQKDGYGLSYLYPKTREYILNVLKEASSFTGVDGVTLDYCRYPEVISSEADLDTKVQIMNDFMRQVRRELKGKTIAVRIPYNDYNSYGYDIETWIREGLIDILIPSNITKDDFFDIKPFVQLVSKKKIKLYVGICADVDGHDLTKEEEELIKEGLYVHNKTYLTIHEYMKRTAEIYKAGGDGIFLFNTSYSIFISNNSPKEASLLGDKVAMMKWYTFEYNEKPKVKKIFVNR